MVRMGPCLRVDWSSTKTASFTEPPVAEAICRGALYFSLCRRPSAVTSWTESVLYNFSGGSDGGNPVAEAIINNRGRLFGTASTGGSGGSLGRSDL